MRNTYPDPVTGLVGERVAEVVVGGRAAGHRGVEHDDTIVGGRARVRRWEGRVAEETLMWIASASTAQLCGALSLAYSAGAGLEANSVDVEVRLAALAERSLHRRLVGRIRPGLVEPVDVGRTVSARKDELIAGARVGRVDDSDLVSDLRVPVSQSGPSGSRLTVEDMSAAYGMLPPARAVLDWMTWK